MGFGRIGWNCLVVQGQKVKISLGCLGVGRLKGLSGCVGVARLKFGLHLVV